MIIICKCELLSFTLQCKRITTMSTTDKMRNVGLKVTPQRKQVYEIIEKLAHASIEEIIIKAQQENSEITVSTIYRILNSFCDNNLLGKVNHPNGRTYYDINTHEHHHIVTSNQELIDIDDPELTQLIRQRVLEKIGVKEQVDKISIQIMTSMRQA